MAELLASNRLKHISKRVKQRFTENRTLLTFDAWFELFLKNPQPHLRSAAQYTKDVFDYFGKEERQLPAGPVTRYKIFDAPWSEGQGRVAGQERVQEEIYRLISGFVREGRVSKLILLHGPNGSAKSSLIRCIQSGLETYSQTLDGTLYSYAWIFPTDRIEKGRLGFGGEHTRPNKNPSYAHLPVDEIDARLPCELREPPIFFLPKSARLELIEQLRAEKRVDPAFVVPRYITDGDLSPRDKAIYDALLLAYDGDHEQVLRHVQVERFYLSRQYGKGIATVEPQMHVDAETRQLTADRSIANLPRPLQTVPLYELSGPLVSANRGLLEFSDLLKRPVEAFKYLLTTSEEATASLPQFNVVLDQLLIASSNEKQLLGFKDYPDWNSFKGRIELVRVPYLRIFQDEVAIYRNQITSTSINKPIAPHVVEVAARWAVLTRLEAPDSDRYPDSLRHLVARLTPTEKLELYDCGKIPNWIGANESRELMGAIANLYTEYRGTPLYEGQLGASAREIRTLIQKAAERVEYRSLTPLPIFEELQELVADRSLYDFLRREPHRGYHQPDNFVAMVQSWWLDIYDDEIRHAMGLVEGTRYDELFERYVRHVSALVKKERLLDQYTGHMMDPDHDLLDEVEEVLLAERESRDEFRKAVIGRIGAWGLEHAGQTPNYRVIFPQYIERIEENYYRQQRRVIAKNLQAVLMYMDEETNLSEELRAVAKQTIAILANEYGYHPTCVAECTAHLLRQRYDKDLP
ncbi:MAG: serine protein kinase PrkA [Myxococcales bacterium]|nr:serine protein kinase PrkA [Myxococcales bacterium]